jgi:UDP-N-acetylglucosamine 3-dehydrogenase
MEAHETLADRTPIRIIVVGAGRMGCNHIRVVQTLTDFQLVGIVEPNPAYLMKSGVSFSCPIYKMVSDVPADLYEAAILAAPNHFHLELGSMLVQSGKDLLVEKPVASSVADGHALITLAEETGVKLAVGYIERFNPAVLKLKQVIESGYLGTPIHFSCTRVGGYPADAGRGNNVLLDLAVHDIDVLSLLCGHMQCVGSVCHASVNPGVLDTAEILLKAADNTASASVHVNWITPTKIRSLRVTGSGGVALIDYMLQTCVLFGGDISRTRVEPQLTYAELIETYKTPDKIEFQVRRSEPLRGELEHFAKLIRGEPSLSCLGPHALYSLRLAEEVFSHV